MNNLTAAKRKTDGADTTVSKELNKVSTSAFALSAVSIASWATVTFFAGAMDAGGPLNLFTTLFNIING